MKTALKLAMHSENGALMQLCAMALKNVYILKSTYPASSLISYLNSVGIINDAELSKNKVDSGTAVIHLKIPTILTRAIFLSLSLQFQMASTKHLSTDGVKCSDFSYKSDDPISDLQLSNSSQFHLSNLLLLTLVEKAIKDKKFLPLWYVWVAP